MWRKSYTPKMIRKSPPERAQRALRIAARFNGVANLARVLRVKYTTVQQWTQRGIPAHWQDAVLHAAKEHRIDVVPEDFFIAGGLTNVHAKKNQTHDAASRRTARSNRDKPRADTDGTKPRNRNRARK